MVLRIGHRGWRDFRITTHLCLAARALGAQGVLLSAKDENVVHSVEKVVGRWGGDFYVEDGVGWKSAIRKWKEEGGVVCHLTMYGERMTEVAPVLREGKRDLMVVVGAEKVPGEVYELSDYNVAVGNQPHSEVAALAVFLDRLFPDATERRFENATLEITPSNGKKLVKGTDEHDTQKL
ncbi:MAG: tRNA (cytidine(56)-2'-O)-methyltransferase [Methermicoccaceae archaeon]